MSALQSEAARQVARKSHRAGVVVVAVVAVSMALVGTAQFVTRAFVWSTASGLHGVITYGGIAACLVASRVGRRPNS